MHTARAFNARRTIKVQRKMGERWKKDERKMKKVVNFCPSTNASNEYVRGTKCVVRSIKCEM